MPVDLDDLEEAPPDDRPPICPACGVTMGIVTTDDGAPADACLECGFGEEDAYPGRDTRSRPA